MKKSIVISLLTVACIFGTAICSFASTGIVTTDTLRLRKDASTSASILGLLSMNDKVEILEEENGWYKVKAGEEEGYVYGEYIKVLEEKTTPEQTVVEEEQSNTEEKPAENTETESQENKEKIKTVPAETEIYITPVINSLTINKTTEEKTIEIISEVKGWSYIKTGSIQGWIRTEKIVEKEVSENETNNTSSQKTGYITTNSVNFREEANTSSNIISKLPKNAKLNIIESSNGWSKVEYNGTTGYVSEQYISDKKIETSSRSSSSVNRNSSTSNKKIEPPIEGDISGSAVVKYAKQFVGYKYVYGGASPSGFDCSGFTQYVYKQFGYSLKRSAASQSSDGVGVKKENLKEGDIICFSNSRGSSSIGHVGLYIGGGKVVHAANSRRGVIISNVDGDGFYYVCARRIIN